VEAQGCRIYLDRGNLRVFPGLPKSPLLAPVCVESGPNHTTQKAKSGLGTPQKARKASKSCCLPPFLSSIRLLRTPVPGRPFSVATALSVHCLGQTKVRLKPPVPGGGSPLPLPRIRKRKPKHRFGGLLSPTDCFRSKGLPSLRLCFRRERGGAPGSGLSPQLVFVSSSFPKGFLKARGYAFASQNIVSAVFFPRLIASSPVQSSNAGGGESLPLPKICKRKPECR
jgi:hypothetical protein